MKKLGLSANLGNEKKKRVCNSQFQKSIRNRKKKWLQKNLLPREKSFVKNCRRKEDL
jgi:hypothetical protein